jgi:hypothetical protein
MSRRAATVQRMTVVNQPIGVVTKRKTLSGSAVTGYRTLEAGELSGRRGCSR